jgi:hypothetical protein
MYEINVLANITEFLDLRVLNFVKFQDVVNVDFNSGSVLTVNLKFTCCHCRHGVL